MWAIVALAVLLRLLSALLQGSTVDPLPGIHDQLSYHALAQRVINGHGFTFATNHWPATRAGEPTAHWSYLYTLYLSGVYLLFGTNPLVARLVQAVAGGVLHTVFAWRIGRRIFGETVGTIAALLSALYTYFVYYSGALITETFYIVAMLWTFDTALRLAAQAQPNTSGTRPPQKSWWTWAEFGIALGTTALLRQLFLLFVPFLFIWLWWAHRPLPSLRRGFLARLALSTTLLVAMIVPWTIRNYRAFHQVVPLNTNAGYVLYWGNHPHYGTDFVGILPAGGPTYYDLLPKELLHLDEAALDRALLKRGLNFIRQDPFRFLRLSLSRTEEYFKFWPSPESSTLSNIARVTSFGLLLPFILYGLGISLSRIWRTKRRNLRSGVGLLALFCLVYTLIHLLTWTLIRYRLPVDAVLLLFASAGIVDLLGKVSAWPILGNRSLHSTAHDTVGSRVN